MRLEVDPDPAWVATLGGCTHRVAGAAIDEARKERALFLHLRGQHRAEHRASYVEIDAPLELYALARILRPRHVLEVGVSSGVSSAYLLQALDQNARGTLHSVDLPSRPRAGSGGPGTMSWSIPPGRTSGWAVPMALKGRWDLRLGDKAQVVPLLTEEVGRFDLVLYDVPHAESDLVREFARIDPRLTPEGAVIVDHGPGGGLCTALRRLARRRGSTPVRRSGLGLFGARMAKRLLAK